MLALCGYLAWSVTEANVAAAQGAGKDAGGAVHVPARMKPPGSPAFRPVAVPHAPTAPRTKAMRSVVLPALSEEVLNGLKHAEPGPAKGRVPIGITRTLDEPVRVDASTTATDWTVLADGTRVWSLEVAAPGATGLRLHLEGLTLPAGASVLVYDPTNANREVAAVTAETVDQDKAAWTETVFSDRVILECQLPAGVDPKGLAFVLTGVSHRFAPQFTLKDGLAGPCELDVSCYPAWSSAANGVARIEFIDSGVTYLCTGCLLNDSDPSTFIDYFLTANHCINNATAAATLELFWFDQTVSCNGPVSTGVVHTSGGADFLAGSTVSDYSLLRLRQSSPGGAVFLGWTTAAPAPGEQLVAIHHPRGDYKRISFASYQPGIQVPMDPDFFYVQWSNGITEDGSSGSPLFNSSQEVIGQLYGGDSACLNPAGIDQFGKFSTSYLELQAWLGTSAATVFTPQKATYTGLFSVSNGVAVESAGLVTILTTTRGTFTGNLQTRGRRYLFSGRFNAQGQASVSARRVGLSPLTLEMQVNLDDPSQLSGSVSDTSWTATLNATQAAYDGRSNLAPQAGTYTLFVPGTVGSALEPAGDGFGTVSVDKAGRVRFVGSLADGTRVSQAGLLSRDGEWPFFIVLYSGGGLLTGPVLFLETSSDDLTGTLTWIKPNLAQSRYYPAGFTVTSSAAGARYTRPSAGVPALPLAEGEASFDGGNLAEVLTNLFALGANNRVTDLSGQRFRLSFNTSSGLFRGSVLNPATGKSLSFSGAIQQKQGSGSGFFLGRDQSGLVNLGPGAGS